MGEKLVLKQMPSLNLKEVIISLSLHFGGLITTYFLKGCFLTRGNNVIIKMYEQNIYIGTIP